MSRLNSARALDLMRKGAVMVREHKRNGEDGEYFLVPGGPLDRRVAAVIERHPQVHGGTDGMWPGYDQTWKIYANA